MVLHFAFMSEVLFDNSEVPFFGMIPYRLRHVHRDSEIFETASLSHESAFRLLELNPLNSKIKI